MKLQRQRSYSLSARLTRMNLLVSGTVLILAALAFFSYDLLSFRQMLIRNLDADAQIVGENSVTALLFNDQETATATLKGLEHSPDVLSAVLFDSDGTLFARYGEYHQIGSKQHPLGTGEDDRVWSAGTHVLLAHRIVFQGKTVGVVYIAAQLTEIGSRMRQYLLIAFAIFLFCMLAALAISASSRRLIARPIIALADTAMLVSRERDYTVRADVQADSNEISVLIDAFNTMLAQIDERDAALTRSRNELETRVAERTSELTTANRELEAFSYTVAHDLRGPLDAIGGIGYLLAHACNDAKDPSVQPMLEQLQTSIVSMGTLIDDLLNFARSTTAPLAPAPLDLTAMAHEIAAELKASDPSRDVGFQIDATPVAQADAGLMRIVLDNLLRNAWKYSSQHAKACIEFGAKQETADGQPTGKTVYFVRDDGAGFDQTRADQLFHPFQRLHGQREFPGTGIGLATVERILSRQGGSIWAEAAVEKGATFYFTLN